MLSKIHKLCLAHTSSFRLQANYSLSGAFHRLSKLILCAVMLRGRHRGLPVALDRAVMLPHEFRQRAEEKQPARPDSPHHLEEQRDQDERKIDLSQPAHSDSQPAPESTEPAMAGP